MRSSRGYLNQSKSGVSGVARKLRMGRLGRLTRENVVNRQFMLPFWIIGKVMILTV